MRRDYRAGDKISRQEGFEDFLEDFPRMGRAIKERNFREMGHVWKDFFVNAWRIIGVADRDRSQMLGGFCAIVLPLILAVEIIF